LCVIKLRRKIVHGEITRPLEVPTCYKAPTPITKLKQKYDLGQKKYLLKIGCLGRAVMNKDRELDCLFFFLVSSYISSSLYREYSMTPKEGPIKS
jgi:hypothetical protein